MKTENAIIIILILIIIIATGIFTFGNLHLSHDSGGNSPEISHDSSNVVDSGGSSHVEEPSQEPSESADTREISQDTHESASQSN